MPLTKLPKLAVALAALAVLALPWGGAHAKTETKVAQPPKTVLQYKTDLASAAKLSSLPTKLATPIDLVTNKNLLYGNGCHSMGNEPGASTATCRYGDPAGKFNIWLIGDSHASQWFPAIDAFAKLRGASLTVHTKSSCPIMLGQPFYPNTNKPYVNCQDYNDWIFAQLSAANPDLLIVANYQGLERLYLGQVAFGLDRLATVAKRVVLLGDTPKQLGLLPPCLKKQPATIQKCAVSTSKAYFPQVTDGLKRTAQRNGYGLVETRTWFCTSSVCPPVVANRVMYADATHISIDAAKYFANRMAMALNAQISQPAK